jgi:hypothetical protein
MSGPHKFSNKRASVDVEIDGEQYVILEASSSAGAKYRSAKLASFTFKMDKDAKPTDAAPVSGLGDIEPLLVSECLFKLPDRTPVPLGTVRGWRDEIVKAMYDIAKSISPSLNESPSKDDLLKQRARIDEALAGMNGTNGKGSADLKNSPESTTAGST